MPQEIKLILSPEEAAEDATIIERIAMEVGVQSEQVTGFHKIKQSIDARRKTPLIQLTVNAYINEPIQRRTLTSFEWKDVTNAKHTALIIGSGPAGLFAALRLIERGIKPIVIERGKDVRSRRRDLAQLNKEGIVNEDSNYCFGEGGAGTYSDGKLYTRSSKRGDIDRILQLFVRFGAEDRILYEA
ncbi:MAG: FAD-dependent monooxygenase, partial [Bacteroidota bacterium]